MHGAERETERGAEAESHTYVYVDITRLHVPWSSLCLTLDLRIRRRAFAHMLYAYVRIYRYVNIEMIGGKCNLVC